MERAQPQERRSKRHRAAVLTVLFSAIIYGATFLFALYRQLPMVEVAASLGLGVQLYLLSASVGDWIEDKADPSRSRVWIAVALAGGIVCYFVIARLLQR
jgi:uncharacterized membrane protein (GlpM family)